MKKYTRKTIKVEAIQWTGENDDKVSAVLEGYFQDHLIQNYQMWWNELGVLCISLTLPRGSICLQAGDYIIRRGNFIDVIIEERFKEEYEDIEDDEELTPEQKTFKEGLTKVMFDYMKSNLK